MSNITKCLDYNLCRIFLYVYPIHDGSLTFLRFFFTSRPLSKQNSTSTIKARGKKRLTLITKASKYQINLSVMLLSPEVPFDCQNVTRFFPDQPLLCSFHTSSTSSLKGDSVRETRTWLFNLTLPLLS